MQIILWILTTLILSNTTSPWYLSWIVTLAIFMFVLLVAVFPAFVRNKFVQTRNAALQVPGMA